MAVDSVETIYSLRPLEICPDKYIHFYNICVTSDQPSLLLLTFMQCMMAATMKNAPVLCPPLRPAVVNALISRLPHAPHITTDHHPSPITITFATPKRWHQ